MSRFISYVYYAAVVLVLLYVPLMGVSIFNDWGLYSVIWSGTDWGYGLWGGWIESIWMWVKIGLAICFATMSVLGWLYTKGYVRDCQLEGGKVKKFLKNRSAWAVYCLVLGLLVCALYGIMYRIGLADWEYSNSLRAGLLQVVAINLRKIALFAFAATCLFFFAGVFGCHEEGHGNSCVDK